MIQLFISLMAGGKEGGGSGLEQFMFLIPIMLVFYFFMIRPQMRKAKKQKQFREEIGKGDKIVTIGGLHGKIVEVEDTTFIVELFDKTLVKLEKSAVSMETTMALADANKNGGTKKEDAKKLEEKKA